MTLGRVRTADKSNEITAISELLATLDIKGAIITIDAMGCLHDVAAKIVASGADYVLGVKDNQPGLNEAVKPWFDAADGATMDRPFRDDIVREGERANPAASGRVKQSTTVNLLRRFHQYGDAVLRFVGDFAVPFNNNTAERAVRMPKVKQKISGCLRTLDGAEYFCVVRYCLDTPRKQGHTMRAVLQHVFPRTAIQSTA